MNPAREMARIRLPPITNSRENTQVLEPKTYGTRRSLFCGVGSIRCSAKK